MAFGLRLLPARTQRLRLPRSHEENLNLIDRPAWQLGRFGLIAGQRLRNRAAHIR